MTVLPFVTDDLLMAYVDGALDAEARAKVDAMLVQDPDLQQRVDRLGASAALLRQAVEPLLHAPPPQALIDEIRFGNPEKAEAPEAVKPRKGRGPAWRPYAIAASVLVALGAGLSAGLHLQTRGTAVDTFLAVGPVPETSLLQAVLEERGSGLAVELDPERPESGRRALVAVQTFMDAAARPCREVELLRPGSSGAVADWLSGRPAEVAVACRSEAGGWTVEGAAQIAVEETSGDGSAHPVSGPEVPTLDVVIESLGAGLPLSPEEEAQLMSRGWR